MECIELDPNRNQTCVLKRQLNPSQYKHRKWLCARVQACTVSVYSSFTHTHLHWSARAASRRVCTPWNLNFSHITLVPAIRRETCTVRCCLQHGTPLRHDYLLSLHKLGLTAFNHDLFFISLPQLYTIGQAALSLVLVQYTVLEWKRTNGTWSQLRLCMLPICKLHFATLLALVGAVCQYLQTSSCVAIFLLKADGLLVILMLPLACVEPMLVVCCWLPRTHDALFVQVLVKNKAFVCI